MIRIVSFALLALSAAAGSIDSLVNDPSIIDAVNNDPSSTWKAHPNSFFEGKTLDQAKRLMGAHLTHPSHSDVPRLAQKIRLGAEPIPESFDVREKWGSMCPDMLQVSDQGNCGSCVFVSLAKVASGRACVASNGTITPPFSGADALGCCTSAGCSGCNGAFLDAAWEYYRTDGLVTGGEFRTNTGLCYDYPLYNCEHHVENSTSGLPDCDGDVLDTPTCPYSCPSTPSLKWSNDKHYASHVYRLPDVESIQRDLMEHGPLQVAYTVFSDFMTYKEGIYQHKTNDEVGGHAVTLVGWGVENGTEYWTCVNNWRSSWGDHGTFKILRGVNECGIEESVYGGITAL